MLYWNVLTEWACLHHGNSFCSPAPTESYLLQLDPELSIKCPAHRLYLLWNTSVLKAAGSGVESLGTYTCSLLHSLVVSFKESPSQQLFQISALVLTLSTLHFKMACMLTLLRSSLLWKIALRYWLRLWLGTSNRKPILTVAWFLSNATVRKWMTHHNVRNTVWPCLTSIPKDASWSNMAAPSPAITSTIHPAARRKEEREGTAFTSWKLLRSYPQHLDLNPISQNLGRYSYCASTDDGKCSLLFSHLIRRVGT